MDNNNKKVLLGFIAGAAVGAIAGILLAPETGKVTRENLGQRGSKLKDDFNGVVKNGVEKLNSIKDSAFSLVNSYGNEGNQPANGFDKENQG